MTSSHHTARARLFPADIVHAISAARWRALFETYGAPPALDLARDGDSVDAIDASLRGGAPLPERLARPLAVLEALSSEAGRDALLDAALDRGVDARDWPKRETPGDLVARLLVDASRDEGASGLIERALLRVFRAGNEARTWYELLVTGAPKLGDAKALEDGLAKRLRVWCKRHGRRRAVHVRVVEDGAVTWVEVRRSGRLAAQPRVRANGTIARGATFPLVADLLRYDATVGLLSIASSSPEMVRAYRRLFARAALGDARVVSSAPVYTLRALTERGPDALVVEALAAQVRRVRLIEIEWDAGNRETHALRGQDCFAALLRDGVRLEGGRVLMAKLRFELATTPARSTSCTVWPPHRVRLPQGAAGRLVRAWLRVAGIETGARLVAPRRPDDLWSLDPWVHPERTWRAALGDATCDVLLQVGALEPSRARVAVHPKYPEHGRTLTALPLEREAGRFYGVALDPVVPSRTLEPEDLECLVLDLDKLGARIAKGLGLDGTPHEVDGLGVIDLGARHLGAGNSGARVRVFFAARSLGWNMDAIARRLRASDPSALTVLVVPHGRRTASGLPEVELAANALAGLYATLLGDIVRALDVAGEVDPVAYAPAGTRLVIEEKAGHVWFDGVPVDRAGEKHVKLLAQLARSRGPLAGKELGPAKTRTELQRLVARSFRERGLDAPEGVDLIVVKDAAGGFRLGVAFHLV